MMNIKTTSASMRAIQAYEPNGSAKGKSSPAGSAPAKSMTVALSAGSQALFDSSADVDMAKVQAIRDSLANGTLKINPERIAQALIDSADELMG